MQSSFSFVYQHFYFHLQLIKIKLSAQSYKSSKIDNTLFQTLLNN